MVCFVDLLKLVQIHPDYSLVSGLLLRPRKNQPPGFESQHHHLLAVWSWEDRAASEVFKQGRLVWFASSKKNQVAAVGWVDCREVTEDTTRRKVSLTTSPSLDLPSVQGFKAGTVEAHIHETWLVTIPTRSQRLNSQHSRFIPVYPFILEGAKTQRRALTLPLLCICFHF